MLGRLDDAHHYVEEVQKLQKNIQKSEDIQKAYLTELHTSLEERGTS